MDKSEFITYFLGNLERELDKVKGETEYELLLDARCILFKHLNHIVKRARKNEQIA